MIPKGLGMPSTSPHPMGMSPDTFARRRLLLAQRAGIFRGPIPTGNAAQVWRNFSSNLSGDAHQYGYQNPLQWLHDSATAGQPVHGPQFLGGPTMAPPQSALPPGLQAGGPGAQFTPDAGGMQHMPPNLQPGGPMQLPQQPTPMSGFMAVENPQIKQMLAQALASLQRPSPQSPPLGVARAEY